MPKDEHPKDTKAKVDELNRQDKKQSKNDVKHTQQSAPDKAAKSKTVKAQRDGAKGSAESKTKNDVRKPAEEAIVESKQVTQKGINSTYAKVEGKDSRPLKENEDVKKGDGSAQKIVSSHTAQEAKNKTKNETLSHNVAIHITNKPQASQEEAQKTKAKKGDPIPTVQVDHEEPKAQVPKNDKADDRTKGTQPKPERKMSYAKVAQTQNESAKTKQATGASSKTTPSKTTPTIPDPITIVSSLYGGAGGIFQFRNPFDSSLPLIRMSGSERSYFGTHFAEARLGKSGMRTFADHREDLCKAVAILSVQPDRERTLLNFTGTRGAQYDRAGAYTLESTSKVATPLQRYHTSPLTITHDMANEKFRDVKSLLKKLNEVLGTEYTPNRPGLSAFLQSYLDESCDFGQIYGQLRPWWFRGNFDRISALIQKRKEEDSLLRRNAVDGDCIINPNVPPRRVWDLFSNRVMPFYVLPVASPSTIPDNVWAVSHSWKEEKQRTRYRTRINGEAWYVPLPKNTDPHDVRVELLNLGAEYVFLDVLCLRQYDQTKPGQEFRRKREWRVDVPTIGYVYQPPRITVVYFNGLGEPFTMTPEGGFDSKYHWFKRVWTLQEACQNWLPGGLTATSLPAASQEGASLDFSNRLLTLLEITEHRSAPDMFKVLAANCARAHSNPVDSVAALAYLLGCTSLPIYNADLDVEGAWEALIESMTPLQRLTLLVCWGGAGDSEGLYAWRPSWKQLMTYDFSHINPSTKLFDAPPYSDQMEDELLEYLPNAGHQDSSDAYFHYAYVVQSCSIRTNVDQPPPKSPAKSRPSSVMGSDVEDEDETLNDTTLDAISPRARTPDPASQGSVTVRAGKRETTFQVAAFGCPLGNCKGDYVLVGVANCRYWIVGRKKGSRRVGAGRGGALVLSKATVLVLDEGNGHTPQSDNLGQVDMVVYC